MHLHSLLSLLALFSTVILSMFTPLFAQDDSNPRLIIYNYNPEQPIHSIYSLAPDGSDIRLLAQGNISSPHVSPDKNWVVYKNETLREMYRVNMNGIINELLLEPSEGTDYWFSAWLNDESNHFVAEMEFYGEYNLVVVNPDSHGRTTLLERDSPIQPHYAGKSANGEWIFYTHSDNAESPETTLYRVRSDGSDGEALITIASPVHDLRWVSDDGQTVLYTTTVEDDFEVNLWLLRVGDSEPTAFGLIRPARRVQHGVETNPLLVTADENLYRVDIENKALVLVLEASRSDAFLIHPNGQDFTTLRGTYEGEPVFFQGSFDSLPIDITTHYNSYYLAGVSPDSEWVIFDNYETYSGYTYQVHRNGENIVRIELPWIHGGPYGTFETWSPDSQYAYFEIQLTRGYYESNISRWSLRDGVFEEITNLPYIETVIGWGNGIN